MNESLKEQLNKYPISEVIASILDSISCHDLTVLQAPPGSGKSTVLPLFLLKAFHPKKKVVLVQPRRLACKSVAERLSATLGEKPGKRIGYKVRFESNCSNETVIEVVTEGILLQQLMNDPFLEHVGLLIFDEFHERNLSSDIGFILSRYTQKHLKPDLKLLLMSATLNSESLIKKLSNAAFIEAKGKTYEVNIHHHPKYVSRDWQEVFIEKVISAFRDIPKGHLLGFLPGKAEIFKVKQALESNGLYNVYPLHGDMSLEEQRKCVTHTANDSRKIILSTNIAETSLTIEGVRIVVDSGWQRKARFDSGSGLNKLETLMISLESAKQRAGRAGRTESGDCFRIWSKAQEEQMELSQSPEILSVDLSNTVLTLAYWGSLSLHDYEWIDFPPQKNYEQSILLLEELNCIAKGKITEKGKTIAALPLPVRLANMIVMAKDKGMTELAIDLACIMEEKDFLGTDLTSDLEFRLNCLHQFRNHTPYEGQKNQLERIEKACQHLQTLVKPSLPRNSNERKSIGWLLAQAYPERIAKPIDQKGKFKLANGHTVMLNKSENYLKPDQWLVVASYQANAQNGLIYLAVQTKPEEHLELLTEEIIVEWDESTEWFKAQKTTKIKGLDWKTTFVPISDTTIEEQLLQLVQTKGLGILGFNEKHEQLIARINSLKKWNPEIELPLFRAENLFEDLKEHLLPFLKTIKTKSDFAAFDLMEVIHSCIGWDKVMVIDQLAPAQLTMPSGYKNKLTYDSLGSQPILEVKMQEIFGLTDTPTVNNGQTKVLLHLLSPRGIPVQITQDLYRFWVNTYPTVVKELRMNYPKHYWPENPLEAKAIRGTKKQNGL